MDAHAHELEMRSVQFRKLIAQRIEGCQAYKWAIQLIYNPQLHEFLAEMQQTAISHPYTPKVEPPLSPKWFADSISIKHLQESFGFNLDISKVTYTAIDHYINAYLDRNRLSELNENNLIRSGRWTNAGYVDSELQQRLEKQQQNIMGALMPDPVSITSLVDLYPSYRHDLNGYSESLFDVRIKVVQNANGIIASVLSFDGYESGKWIPTSDWNNLLRTIAQVHANKGFSRDVWHSGSINQP